MTTPGEIIKSARKWSRANLDHQTKEVRFAARGMLQLVVLCDTLQTRVKELEAAAGPGPFDALPHEYDDGDTFSPEESGVFKILVAEKKR